MLSQRAHQDASRETRAKVHSATAISIAAGLMRRTAATRTDTQWPQSAQQLAAFPSRKRGENRGILFENAAKGWPVVLKPHSKSAPNGGGDDLRGDGA